MLVTTTENVPGQHVREVKGQVFGVVVRSRGLGGNILVGLRSIGGGERAPDLNRIETYGAHGRIPIVRH